MKLPGDDYCLICSSCMGSMVAGSSLLSAILDEQIEVYEDLQNDFYEETLGISSRVTNLSGFIGRLGWKAQVTNTMNFIAGATFNEVGLAHSRNYERKRTQLGACHRHQRRPERPAVYGPAGVQQLHRAAQTRERQPSGKSHLRKARLPNLSRRGRLHDGFRRFSAGDSDGRPLQRRQAPLPV